MIYLIKMQTISLKTLLFTSLFSLMLFGCTKKKIDYVSYLITYPDGAQDTISFGKNAILMINQGEFQYVFSSDTYDDSKAELTYIKTSYIIDSNKRAFLIKKLGDSKATISKSKSISLEGTGGLVKIDYINSVTREISGDNVCFGNKQCCTKTCHGSVICCTGNIENDPCKNTRCDCTPDIACSLTNGGVKPPPMPSVKEYNKLFEAGQTAISVNFP
ncbi:MAG TPA: hypothetical protein PLC48_10345 [Ferruginibacter sp.]|nr:hypothetical protein [Ferruginibacter sp.]